MNAKLYCCFQSNSIENPNPDDVTVYIKNNMFQIKIFYDLLNLGFINRCGNYKIEIVLSKSSCFEAKNLFKIQSVAFQKKSWQPQ